MEMRMRRWLRGVLVLGAVLAAGAALAQKPIEIKVDLAKRVGPYEPIYRWFGFDEANYATAPNGRKLLGELHAMSPVPVYIRSHHLLTSGDGTPELKWSSTGVYHEDAQGRPVYE